MPKSAATLRSYTTPRPDVTAFVPVPCGRVLDVGCSDGSLGRALRNDASEVVGIEPDPELAERARERLDRVIVADAGAAVDELEGLFDVVICADVLEHMPDPQAILGRLRGLLAPTGRCIVSLPNVRFYTTFVELGLRGRWPRRDRGVHDRTHLTWFTDADARAMFAACDLAVADTVTHYRLADRYDRFASWVARGPLKPFLAYQYVYSLAPGAAPRAPASLAPGRGARLAAWRAAVGRTLPVPAAEVLARAFRRARALWLRGAGTHCPCCGHSYRAMLPARRDGRLAVCPGCGSLERHRALWLLLRDEIGVLERPMRVLQIAPEPGVAEHLSDAPNVDYVAGDLYPPKGMRRLDVTGLPFGAGSFDVVLCNHVLEHVPDDRRAMAEIRRVLKPGGRAVLDVPLEPERAHTDEDPAVTDPRERLVRFGQEDHVRTYGRDYYVRLREAGLDVELVSMVERLGRPAAARNGLDPDEVLVSCSVSLASPEDGPERAAF